MSQLVSIVVFWVVVVIAVRLAVLFPESSLARVLFYRIGPTRRRNEFEADYLLRWSRSCASWFAQATLVLVVGWAWLRLDATLDDSLFVAVLWLVIVPLLAATALVGALLALIRSTWVRHRGRTAQAPRSVHEREA